MIQRLFFRLLRLSGVFNYWYRRHLIELLYDLELYNLEPKLIIEKYSKQLAKIEK